MSTEILSAIIIGIATLGTGVVTILVKDFLKKRNDSLNKYDIKIISPINGVTVDSSETAGFYSVVGFLVLSKIWN